MQDTCRGLQPLLRTAADAVQEKRLVIVALQVQSSLVAANRWLRWSMTSSFGNTVLALLWPLCCCYWQCFARLGETDEKQILLRAAQITGASFWSFAYGATWSHSHCANVTNTFEEEHLHQLHRMGSVILLACSPLIPAVSSTQLFLFAEKQQLQQEEVDIFVFMQGRALFHTLACLVRNISQRRLCLDAIRTDLGW